MEKRPLCRDLLAIRESFHVQKLVRIEEDMAKIRDAILVRETSVFAGLNLQKRFGLLVFLRSWKTVPDEFEATLDELFGIVG